VLGQVKESHRIAQAAGMTGPTLEAVLQGAYAAAKRVRNETSVAEQPVSIVASALMVARGLHGALDGSTGLLIGLGEMSELLGSELRDAGLEDLVVIHASAARAEAAAHRLHCHFRPWEQLEAALAEADIVVAASGSGQYTITPELAEQALRRRRRRPILFIDAAVPGDVDPAVDKLDGAFVYDLGDLERVARAGKATREGTAVAAWRIVGEEIESFLRQRAERAAVPAVNALRRHFEAVRAQILAQGGLDAEAATRLLVNRLLHDPSEVLRAAAAGTSDGDALDESVVRLFRLEAGGGKGENGT
jgi:glutamyl-tRNA reductase